MHMITSIIFGINKEFAIEYLYMSKFFSMFTQSEFLDSIFPVLILKKYDKNDVIFTRK